MDENRTKRGGTWVAVVLVMLLLAYPLSIGPAFAVVGANRGNGTLVRVFEVVYAPLRPFKQILEPWIDLWDFHGIRR
ncbi:MAG TPA: hypothetical protein VHC22_00120 [Pirellulales bacterium]|nr:hypothetical protein [Pirellulales bacterium]